MAGDAHLLVRALVAGPVVDRPRLDVDLEVRAGITAVMGPSGSGKTTLLSTIAGLTTPERGRIVLDGVKLFDSDDRTAVPTHQRRVALVFQSLALFPHLRAWQNVAYGLPETARPERRARAVAWLARARVEHLADRFPSSLSGGEAQRVGLARALASEPRALLLDEPFSALDGKLRQALGSELAALVAELGIPSLLVTHHREDAIRLGSRVVELEAGRVVDGALGAAEVAPSAGSDSRQPR
jgi:molybdate transport system ATP-binding protein